MLEIMPLAETSMKNGTWRYSENTETEIQCYELPASYYDKRDEFTKECTTFTHSISTQTPAAYV